MSASLDTQPVTRPETKRIDGSKLYEELTPEEKAAVDELRASGKIPPRGGLIVKPSAFNQRVIDYQTGDPLAWD